MYFMLPGIWPQTMSYQISGNKTDNLLIQEQFQLSSKLPKLKHKHCRICRLSDLLFRLLFSFTLSLFAFVLFLLSLFHISYCFLLFCFVFFYERKPLLNEENDVSKQLKNLL